MVLPPQPFEVTRRVEFSQTDAAGLIHFTTYFIFMEAAEAELFRQLGLPLLWREEGRSFGFPRVDCQCRFRRPVGFGDPVTISLDGLEMVAGRLQYTFQFRDPAGHRCGSGSMTTTLVERQEDGSLASRPLPEAHRKALAAWKNQAG